MWHGYDETTPAATVFVLLGHDLFFEIPGEDQHVVRLGLEQPLRRLDRQSHAGNVAPLLVNVAVDDEIEQLRPEPGVVEHDRAFGRRPVAGDVGAAALQVLQQGGQLRADRGHAYREPRVIGKTVQAEALLALQVFRDGASRARVLFNEQAEGAAVNSQRLDAIQKQAVALEQIAQRGDREVAQVLVIDRVELAVIDEIAHVRCFDDCNTIVLQQRRDAGNEAVRVGDVGQDVVGVNDVRDLALPGEIPRELRSKKGLERVDAALARDRDRAWCGIDAQHGYAALPIELQQITVIAGELDDQALWPQALLFDALADIDRGMPQQHVRD